MMFESSVLCIIDVLDTIVDFTCRFTAVCGLLVSPLRPSNLSGFRKKCHGWL